MKTRHRAGRSATPDDELTLYQLHCRYAILWGRDMRWAAEQWVAMKGRYQTREEHMSELERIVRLEPARRRTQQS